MTSSTSSSQKKISYLSRNFDDYRSQLQSFTAMYYPDVMSDFQDGSIGQFFIDLNSAVSDDLSYHIDRVFQETQIDYAQTRKSLLSIARTKGLKIQGNKGAVVEVQWSCQVPVGSDGNPDRNFLPLIRKGSQATGGGQIFELLDDLDFSHQFGSDGNSDREIIPFRNANGDLSSYIINKKAIMYAGQTNIYKRIISDSDIVPFFSIILPNPNVLNIESIVFKEGADLTYNPSSSDFAYDDEYLASDSNNSPLWKYFEVDTLLDDKRFGDVLTSDAYPGYEVSTDLISSGQSNNIYNIQNVSVVKGQWKPIRQKYITEYTDKGYLKIIFGSSSDFDVNVDAADNYGKYQLTKMINNENLGILPKAGTTCYVQYRIGGGSVSNIGIGTLTNITYLDVDIVGNNTVTSQATSSTVKSTITVTNLTASMGGKDVPSNEEIRYSIKYNNGSQERCVAIPDYIDRINKMPSRYGSPFRFSVTEKNNILFVNILGIDANGNLVKNVSNTLMDNISTYISEYQDDNDYVIIKNGRIMNIGLEADVIISKSYSTSDVAKNIINAITGYLDVSNWKMGQNIYIGDIQNQILAVTGLINLIELRVYNYFGASYSTDQVSQTTIVDTTNRNQIDLSSSDGIIYGDNDSMFQILNPSTDIKLRIKTV